MHGISENMPNGERWNAYAEGGMCGEIYRPTRGKK